MGKDRRVAAAAHHPDRHLRQFLGDGRGRAVRPVLGNLLGPRRFHSGRAAGQRRCRRRPLCRDLEPRLYAVRADEPRRARRAAAALDRYRHGARAHRRGNAGQARQLRHRSVPGADPGFRRGVGDGAGRRACSLAPRHRRPSARGGLSDRRRRIAEQGRARLCAAPHHAPGDAARPYARLQGADGMAAGAGSGAADGRRLSRTDPRPAADRRNPAARRGRISADAGSWPDASRRDGRRQRDDG